MPPPSDIDEQTGRRALASALRAQGICVLHQNAEGRFDLAENLHEGLAGTLPIGLGLSDAFSSDIATILAKASDRLHLSGEEQVVDLQMREGLARQTFQARLQQDGDGTLIVIADVTDARIREAALSSLLREVSHRSKNLLAIVQSVAMQTAQHSGSTQDFLDKFRGRLHALSNTQDLVTESDWRGTYLHTLVTSQLSRVASSQLTNVRITGENPLLGPNASLHVGLAIHELGSNAVLHGALAEAKPGHIWVDARVDDTPGQARQLIIEWQEAGIETADRVRAPRFGTLVLERIVPLSVGGAAELHIGVDSLRYRLSVPEGQFEI